MLRTSIEGILLISHHLSTLYGLTPYCCCSIFKSLRLTSCRLIECVILQHICWVKVRPPYSHQSLSYLKVATLFVSYCPLVPQYEVETSSVSLLSLDTMLSLLDGVGLALLLAHWVSVDVSAYFRGTLRWQTTRLLLRISTWQLKLNRI